jgi:hypothetical protein
VQALVSCHQCVGFPGCGGGQRQESLPSSKTSEYKKNKRLPKQAYKNYRTIDFVFLVGLGFELKALHLQAGTLLLEPHLQSIFLWLFWSWVS